MVVNDNNPKIWASLIAPNPNDVTYWVDLTADPHGNIIKFYDNNDEQWYNLTSPTSEYATYPYIGPNGNWFIENRDSGVRAQGDIPNATINGKLIANNPVLDKYDIGLGNVENLAPADMPISSATAIALAGKITSSRNIIAGDGLTGGGDLSADRIIGITSATDGITVNADNIQLATVDSLTSTSTTKPLSAAQGKALYDKVEEAIAANEYAQGLINGIALGTVNLLRNTAFTGDYVSKDLSASDPLASADKLYSDPLKYWTSYGTNSVFVEADSTSGFGVNINGTLGQPTPKLVAGETYMMSFKAKGSGSLVVGLGTFTISVSLSSTYSEFVLKFVPTETKVYDFYFNGIASIYEPQLERGTIASKWSYSPVDAHKSEERFQAIKYITSAIVDGSVDVIGGLILCNMLQLGNYKDGVLEKVTSGLSGIYNDDDDPAFWSGGTLEDAIRAVMNPDDTEGANAVITHGGKAILNDAIIRGIIYARGGEFFGKVSTSNGGYRVELDPDGTYKLNVYDSIGRRCVAIGLENNTFGTIRFWGYDGETANVVANAQISTTGIIYNYTADAVTYNFAVQAGLTNKMEITATLPLEADAPVGTLCKDVNNFMKVKV